MPPSDAGRPLLRRLLRGTVRVALVALPVLACVARLKIHPSWFFDGEIAIPATIGRELGVCGIDLVMQYQVVSHQGSLVIDPIAAAFTSRLFGTSLLAWHAVPLLYVAAIAAMGGALLNRVGGPVAAIAWCLLLASAPFVVKDGLLSALGGHATGPAYALAALLLAIKAAEAERRAVLWGLAAGVVLAIGAWYVRSVIVAAPAVGIACWHGGWRVRGSVAAGLLLLPVLVVGHTELSGNVLAGVLGGVSAKAQSSLPGKLAETTGWSLAPLMFLQGPDGGATAAAAGLLRAGRAQVLVWLVALPIGLAGAWAWRRAEDFDGRPELPVALLVLAAGWIGAYAVGPFRIEIGTSEALLSGRLLTPGDGTISALRYLVPIYLCWMLVVATAFAVAWRTGTPGRVAGALLVAVFVVVGGTQAARDWTQAEQIHALNSTTSAWYHSILLPGRLPPEATHVRCLGSDWDSREFHLEALAELRCRGEASSGDPRADLERLTAELREVLTPRDLRTLSRACATEE